MSQWKVGKNKKKEGVKTAVKKYLDTYAKSGISYVEFQYHGGVTMDDIEEICVYNSEDVKYLKKKFPRYANLIKQYKW